MKEKKEPRNKRKGTTVNATFTDEEFAQFLQLKIILEKEKDMYLTGVKVFRYLLQKEIIKRGL